jgi:hypothetical protein
MKSLVISSELQNDQKRHNKLEALISTKSNVYEPPTVKIFNTSNIDLPEEINNLLKFGLHGSIRGFSNKNMILAKYEESWSSWKLMQK